MWKLSHTLRGCVDWNSPVHQYGYWMGVTPCVGVWIETLANYLSLPQEIVTPCVGVWIETYKQGWQYYFTWMSHPAWVCGLKRRYPFLKERNDEVTPCVGVWIETGKTDESTAEIMRHTLRGCVDWNRCKMIKWWCPERHTLRGCVDWNTFDYLEEIPAHGHTLRGCIWIEALFTRWSSLWKDCKHSASCVFLFKLL